MKKIIFDIQGNDNGIDASLSASKDFIKNNNNNYKIILVGDEKEILEKEPSFLNNNQIEIINVLEVVNKDLSPLENLRIDNSMNIALKLLKDGEGDGVISSGDSGSFLVSSMFILKKINNIERAAFMPIIPTILENKKFILLDVGANISVKENHLVQWAKMGNIFSKEILNISDPKVYLLNIGTEDNKGLEPQIKANKILKEDKTINYQGFIEPRSLLEGEADVVISDGYAGNITLKTLEGTILSFLKLMKKNLTKNIFRKISTLTLKGAFKEIKEHLDYRNVGSAWVLGVDGIVLKTHGSSDKKAYLGALNQMKNFIEKDALVKIKKEFLDDK
ncbi:MAG: phosphate acyltransferase PlsX [Metamycoplasmataceae bacterium]